MMLIIGAIYNPSVTQGDREPIVSYTTLVLKYAQHVPMQSVLLAG